MLRLEYYLVDVPLVDVVGSSMMLLGGRAVTGSSFSKDQSDSLFLTLSQEGKLDCWETQAFWSNLLQLNSHVGGNGRVSFILR